MRKSERKRKGNNQVSKAKTGSLPVELTQVYQDVAGIDIGSTAHYVSVPEDRSELPVHTFGCFTPDLEAMASLLKRCHIRRVVMEATGVYWVPVFEYLQDKGFQVALVDGRQAKSVPGRKTDVQDCRWLRTIYSYGLLRECFLPEKHVAEVRAYWRQRAEHVKACAQHINMMHKAMEQMNVQLHKAISDVTGVAGMTIIRAIIAGEHDPKALASLVKTRIKATREQIIAALSGHYRAENLFALAQAVEGYDFFHRQMATCDEKIRACLAAMPDHEAASDSGEPPAGVQTVPGKPVSVSRRKNQPHFDLKAELARITGVSLNLLPGIDALTAQTVLSECGYDLSSFSTEHHFASFLGLCPNPDKTGGKVKRNRTRKVTNRAAVALRVAAQSLLKGQSALGAFARRMRARHGTPKAITATAHKLALLIYRMVRYGQAYVETGARNYEESYRRQQRIMLERQARKLGLSIVDCGATAGVS